ncbi:Fpg/Nei family DNA glycosylase [Rarobacter incanus]|uniref:DNA-(apurinic or apyrimidinic site) lyase n=1 Tax=Rarobacter incanus TaxID=153494 RepID=A0A542SL83_9MICO|nr:zinc finger domain-containing protein [Rarobacter incanus]TQK75382.1 endonuclease-8/formamidopyrimidine-DNA glycosylase [Rarobacter incanus]
MPEGHTVHRLARVITELFRGSAPIASSPQGRFAGGAALISGRMCAGAEAYGKQLFVAFESADPLFMQVHLGLYGSWTFAGDGTVAVSHAIGAPRKRVGEKDTNLPAGVAFPPPPRGQVRVRLLGQHAVADLTGPAVCKVITDAERQAVIARLGPDPIRPDADPRRFFAAIDRRSTPIAVALMDQSVIAGVGNIYRAESLFRAGLDPHTPSRKVAAARVLALWSDLVETMRRGAATGTIVTTHDRDSAGGPFYVYRRQGLPCLVCGNAVRAEELAGRKLYWCPSCQRG